MYSTKLQKIQSVYKELCKLNEQARQVYLYDEPELIERLESIQKTISAHLMGLDDHIQTYKEEDVRLSSVVPNRECPNLNCKFSVPFTKEQDGNMIFDCPRCRTRHSISLAATRPEYTKYVDAKMDAWMEDSIKMWTT